MPHAPIFWILEIKNNKFENIHCILCRKAWFKDKKYYKTKRILTLCFNNNFVLHWALSGGDLLRLIMVLHKTEKRYMIVRVL